MSTILVLGANSFSGNSFISLLAQSHEIIAVSRSKKLNPVFNRVSKEKHENVRFETWDLNENPDKIINLIVKRRIKCIVNFSAQSMVGQSWEYPEDWYRANVASFSQFLNRIHREAQIEKFVQFTTPEVYGSTNGWIKENFNFAPSTPYAISRAAGDWHLKALQETFDFPVIFTRAANVYGEGQQLYRVIPRLIVSALTKRKFPLQGGGNSLRSFIHIDDVSHALERILDGGLPGETYHISTRSLVSVFELVETILNKLNVQYQDLINLAPERKGKDFAYQLDSEKIRDELGWTDTISLSDGLDRTIEWVKENLGELGKMPLEYIHRR